MGFFEELDELKKKVLFWFYCWFLTAVFLFSFGLQKISFFGKEILLPAPSSVSFSVLFFDKMKEFLLPQDVRLVALGPMDAFLAQFTIASFLAVFFSFPVIFYSVLSFLSPAFRKKEKKILGKIFFPSFFLFVAGCVFGYFFVLPATFKILYSFAQPMGLEPLYNVNDFLFQALGMIFFLGIMFLLPVAMVLTVALGVIEPRFWRDKWTYAIVFFLVASAIVTPDGTGVTMLILALPLTLLYFLGYTIGKLVKKVAT